MTVAPIARCRVYRRHVCDCGCHSHMRTAFLNDGECDFSMLLFSIIYHRANLDSACALNHLNSLSPRASNNVRPVRYHQNQTPH